MLSSLLETSRQPGKAFFSSLLRPAVSLYDLLDGWSKEAAPAETTKAQWLSTLKEFVHFRQSDDATSVTRSEVLAWKNKLIEKGLAGKTINDSKLVTLRRLFSWGINNELVSDNPAEGVKAEKKDTQPRMQEYTQSEASAILEAAQEQSKPGRRWIPLLCALTGARVGEIAQLRGKDVRKDGDIWYLNIWLEPDAKDGSLKNASSYRQVPIHPHIIEQGFLEFVRSRGDGPLFYNPGQYKPEAKKPPRKLVARDVGRWIGQLPGLEIGRKHRKDPNHAWRHYFKTVCREVRVNRDSVDAIVGHSASSVSQSYGSVSLRARAEAIRQLPVPTK